MKQTKKVAYSSVINLLTLMPYLLFFIFSYQNNDWLIFLLFYLFLYLGNFWISSLHITFYSIDRSLITCLSLGIIGILFTCLGAWHIFFSYIGAVLVGVCVNYCSFLNSLFTRKYDLKLNKKENVYQIFTIVFISLGFVLVIFFSNIYLAFIILLFLLLVALLIQIQTSKISLNSFKLKGEYRFGLSLIPLVIISICFMVLRSIRIDGFIINESLVYSAIIGLFIIVAIIVYFVYKKDVFSFKGLQYSFLKGSLLSMTIIYVSIFSLSNYESSIEYIVINLGVPTLLAVLVIIAVSDKLIQIPLAKLIRWLLMLNFIGAYMVLIFNLIAIGVFIVMFSNLILGNILNEIVFRKKETISKKEEFIIGMHSLKKFGSFFSQSLFFLILIVITVIENSSFDAIFSNKELFVHIRFAMFFTITILLIIHVIYEYKTVKRVQSK